MTEARQAAVDAACKIDGWLRPEEAGLLYDLARSAGAPIVEIGSWRGRSTVALARGSMDGGQQSVYAIDSFVGVPPASRPNSAGDQPGWKSSSPEILRANLDSSGVNGVVQIVAKGSQEAAPGIPECDVLFIDGAHDYSSVRTDLELYLPKVRHGGHVVLHDCSRSDPGVVQAVDDILMPRPHEWRPVQRVASAVVFERIKTTTKRVMLAAPGPKWDFVAAHGLMLASLGANDITVKNSRTGWDDMNTLWVHGLNMAHRGEVTHFAMLHADIEPSPGWIDILASELDRLAGDMISVVVPLKDKRGVTSTGIGDADDHWTPFRRFTIRELHEMPETFGIADTPHPERYLLHNTGCWLADLRNPKWRTVDDTGRLPAWLRATLSFPVGAQMDDEGNIRHMRESEDWYFSRAMAELGLRTFATRKVSAAHYGETPYPNNVPWGDYVCGDEDTAAKWRK